MLKHNMIGVEMQRDFAAEAREVIDNLGWQQTDGSEYQMQVVRHLMDLAGLVADVAGELRDIQQVRQWNEGAVSDIQLLRSNFGA
jgi:hypothetical protein